MAIGGGRAFLAQRPDDFRGAVARIPVDLRRLFVAAFQSWLWNRLLAETLVAENTTTGWPSVEIGGEPWPMPIEWPGEAVPAAVVARWLPLPAARNPIADGALAARMAAIVAGAGLEYRHCASNFRDTSASRGERRIWSTLRMPASSARRTSCTEI